MATIITSANFTEKVLNAEKPVLLDFWASWCGPCRTLGPIIDRLSESFQGRAIIGKVNVDEETSLSEQFKVMSIPSLFVIKNGEVVERMVGARPEAELVALLEKHIK